MRSKLLFSMTIHTTCCQAGGGPAAVPHGVSGDGLGVPAGGGLALVPGAVRPTAPTGPTIGAVTAPGVATTSLGAVAPLSRLATITVRASLAVSASETWRAPATTRNVTSTVVQRRAASGPLSTTRGPTRGARRDGPARPVHPRSP